MSAARREQYFNRNDAGYQVLPEIRKMIVFAPHNLVKDAPFTRLHLITCRNLLIYLRPMAQKKVLSLFHFGLHTGGVVFLGPSESPGELAEEFETLNERWKFFRKRRDGRLPADFRGTFGYQTPTYREPRAPAPVRALANDHDVIATYDRLLDQYMPPAVLVDERRQLVQMFAGAGTYLKLRDGRFSTNILELVQGDLKLALTGALQRVAKSEQPVTCERVRVATDGGEQSVRVDVQPIGKHPQGCKYLITFRELDPPTADPQRRTEAIDLDEISRHRVHELEQELRYSKENLQAAIEELETSNEELQATNEELVASNEELQSTNEELHSVNEELYTVNAEYQRKIVELTELTSDMDNLLVSTKVHTLFLDKQLCIRKFTPEIARVFNLINSDIGRRIDGFTHKLACDGLLDKLTGVLHGTHEQEEHEEEVQDCDGRIYLMRILPYRSNNKTQGAVLTLVDISRQRAAEERLNLSERYLGLERSRLQTVLDQTLCIIYLKDRQGRYLELNQFGAANMGQAREHIIGRTDLEILGPTGAASHEADLQVIATGKRQSGEIAFATPCGERIFYSLKSPLRDGGGNLIGTCGVSVDMTERNEAERSLAREIERRDEFLAMLSHELRNPMGAVLNALEVLREEQPGQTAANDGPGQVIRRQVRHMARLLDDLLDVARIGRSKIEFRREVVDLVALADEVLEAVGYEIRSKQQTLRATVCKGPLFVFGDPARIKQAQINLLINATKYTPDAGDIWYDIQADGGQATITVRDSGAGIRSDLLGSIFDLFVQSETTLARSSGGLGVGLSLARSIVDAHQGSLVAESEGIGKGSTFRMRLPLTEQRPQPKVPAPHFSFRGRRLLLVEDNDDARTMLAKTLRLRGFEVSDAGDGQTALERFRSFRPEVAVIDIGLPMMDGYQVAREVRAMDHTDGVLLIALTGYGRQADRQAALEAGFDAHLVKPLNPDELYKEISQKYAVHEST
jgi:two-component system CheB/CheR fusion protein